MSNTIVLGLDSIDWKFLDKAMERGLMPNIAEIHEKGFHGDLRSIDPPLSVPAWLCFGSGKRPDKLDLYNFRVRERGSYDLNSVSNFESYQENAFWYSLENVGVVGVPSYYPPEGLDFDGFMVAGPFGRDGAYPEDFAEEVESFGYSGDVPNFWRFDDCIRHMEREGDFMGRILSERNPEFFIGVTSVPDRVQHAYCKDEDKMMELYGKADEFVGKILKHTDEEDNVFIVSDHGSADIRKSLYINKWLQQKRFLGFKTGSRKEELKEDLRLKVKKAASEILSNLNLVDFAMDHTPEPVQSAVRNKSGVWDKIDWGKTEAFATGGYVGQIFINTEEDYPEGQISEYEYEEVREKIIEELERLEDPETGEKVVNRVWRKEEIYREEIAERAPDILFYPRDMAYKVNDGFHGKVFDESVPNGSHGLNGVILGRGPDIRQGEFDMHLTDVAPTLLHLMGESVPEDMDGEVQKKIFREGSEPSEREVSFVSDELEDLDF
jgi:predicted AlkP superfamily phosphohydrolase/phosphomutase